jgi:hypothetical protein
MAEKRLEIDCGPRPRPGPAHRPTPARASNHLIDPSPVAWRSRRNRNDPPIARRRVCIVPLLQLCKDRGLVASSSGRGTGRVASSLSPARSAHTYVRAPAGYAACRCKASGTLEKASEGLVAHTPTPRYTDSCMQCCKLAIRLAKRERRARALSDLSDHVSRARAVRRGRRGACVIMGVHCFDYDSNRPSSSEYVSAGVNSRKYVLGTKVQPQGTQSSSRCASLSPSDLWVPNSSRHRPLLSSPRRRRRAPPQHIPDVLLGWPGCFPPDEGDTMELFCCMHWRPPRRRGG